jgi:hypothetical protein
MSAAPTEEISGTTGWTPAFSIATSASATAGEAPDPPRASPLSRTASAARTCAVGQQRPDPPAVRLDQEHLLAADLVLGQPGVFAGADLGGQAVHGVVASKGAIHDRTAGGDRRPGAARQLHMGAVDDGKQGLEGERFLSDRDGAHGTAPKSLRCAGAMSVYLIRHTDDPRHRPVSAKGETCSKRS